MDHAVLLLAECSAWNCLQQAPHATNLERLPDYQAHVQVLRYFQMPQDIAALCLHPALAACHSLHAQTAFPE